MLKAVPLIRDLRRCRRSDYAEAEKEVIATVIFALLPVWLGAVLMVLIPRASVGHYVGEFLSSGEALLISTALIGPSIYIITKKYGDLPKSFTIHFPQGWFLVIFSLMICMITTAIFGMQRIYAQVAPPPNEGLFDDSLMRSFSILVLLLTIVGLYIVTVFKNFAEDGAVVEMHSETAEFLQEWAQK